MTHLTREQVHEILIGLWTAVGGDQARQDGLAVMATDAALRQELEDVPTLRGILGCL